MRHPNAGKTYTKPTIHDPGAQKRQHSIMFGPKMGKANSNDSLGGGGGAAGAGAAGGGADDDDDDDDGDGGAATDDENSEDDDDGVVAPASKKRKVVSTKPQKEACKFGTQW